MLLPTCSAKWPYEVRRLPQPRPAAGRRVRRRPRDGAAMGNDPADLHPPHRGPHDTRGLAGPHDRRSGRGDAEQLLRGPLAPVEPLTVRLDAGPAGRGPKPTLTTPHPDPPGAPPAG